MFGVCSPPAEWSSTLELTDSTDFVEAAKKIGRLRGMAWFL